MDKITITTPSGMSAATYVYIEKRAMEMFGCDKVEHIYDDTLIGGFTIFAGGKLYDSSIRTQFEALKKHISQ